MLKTTRTRLARITIAAGVVATSFVPASGAMAFTPMPDFPIGAIKLPEVPDLPTPPTIPGTPCVTHRCPPLTIPEIPGDLPEIPEIPQDVPERPGDQPERPGDEPERPGDEPERPGDEPERPGDEPEVGDTVVNRPTFTG